MTRIALAIALALLGFFASLSGAQRLMAIGVDKGPFMDFNTALAEAKAAGMNATQLNLTWSMLEPDSGHYNFADNFITWAPGYYASQGLKIFFYLNPIHMMDKCVPADLIDTPFDNPRMISRFGALLDTVLDHLGSETVYFIIGNEVDMNILRDSTDYAKYRVFFNAARERIKARRPDLAVGVAVQYDALLNPATRRFIRGMNDSADALMGTYYFTSADSVLHPALLPTLMDTLIALAQGRPVLFTELGYPSSPVLKSSDLLQAEMVSTAFSAWETRKESVPLINFMKQWEWTVSEVYAGNWFDSSSISPTLMAFLTSLGFHDSLGNPKPAWDRLASEAANHLVPAPLPMNDRFWGVELSPNDSMDQDSAFFLARRAGASGVTRALSWDQIEVEAGVLQDPSSILYYDNIMYKYYPMRYILILPAIDTDSSRVPAFLKGRPLDDSLVVAHYLAMVDFALSKLTDITVDAIALGNETDNYLKEHPSLWPPFLSFYRQAADGIRLRHPGLRVSIKTTWFGMKYFDREHVLEMNQSSDLILVNYYLLDTLMQVADPLRLHVDFDTLCSLFPGRQIYFTEFGCPSSDSFVGGSEEIQRRFVTEAFRAWDNHADQVKCVYFFWLNDIPSSWLDAYAMYYGLDAPWFMAWLGSLGLRTRDNRDKPAWLALQEEFRARRDDSSGLALPGPLPASPLLCAWPNPFNPTVTLSVQGPASLVIFDIRGKRVSAFETGQGRNLVTWDASGFPAGVYLIRARTPGKYLSARVFLEK